MRVRWTSYFMLLALPLLASAADESPAYTRCMEAAGGVTLNMLECIASETQAQDLRLNRLYAKAQAVLEPPQNSQLRDVQRLWIKYRDAECALQGRLTGGSIDAINAALCVLAMTQQRADALEAISHVGEP